MMTHTVSQLSDTQLTAEVQRLARCERAATSSLIIHLAAFDDRRLYLGAAYSSLFAYCRGSLKLSEHEAYHRIVAARAGRTFPLVFEMLAAARLNLTAVRLLAPHLTGENHRELLTSASGKSKRQVQELVAGRFPQPDVPSSVRPIRAAMTTRIGPAEECPTSPPSGPPTLVAGDSAKSARSAGPEVRFAAPPPPTRDAISPLAADRYEVRFTANASMCERLQMAQDLLRHVVPTGDPAQVFDRALTALVENLVQAKFASTEHPRAERSSSTHSRHIPAHVKRAVWLRDAGRCAFQASGRRCEERGFLEFHHLIPFARGGEATADNIALRCRAHNAYEAEQVYGPRQYNGARAVREAGPQRSISEGSTRSGPSSHPAARQQPVGFRGGTVT